MLCAVLCRALQELVRQLIVRVSPHLPELSVRMCLDLMAAADAGSGNWDAAMAGVSHGLWSVTTEGGGGG